MYFFFLSQRLNYKKNLTEIRDFFDFYFKIITPLLVDCWLEAKPENKRNFNLYS